MCGVRTAIPRSLHYSFVFVGVSSFRNGDIFAYDVQDAKLAGWINEHGEAEFFPADETDRHPTLVMIEETLRNLIWAETDEEGKPKSIEPEWVKLFSDLYWAAQARSQYIAVLYILMGYGVRLSSYYLHYYHQSPPQADLRKPLPESIEEVLVPVEDSEDEYSGSEESGDEEGSGGEGDGPEEEGGGSGDGGGDKAKKQAPKEGEAGTYIVFARSRRNNNYYF